MPIKGLMELLMDNAAPMAVRDIKHYAGQEIAINASTAIEKIVIAQKRIETITGQKMEERNVKSLLEAIIFDKTLALLEAGIKPVYVFDDEPPSSEERIVENTALVKLDGDCRRLLQHMGLLLVQPAGKAAAKCATLWKNHKVYAVSGDMDTLTFGAPKFLCNLMCPNSTSVIEFEIVKVLEKLNITMNQFIDLCILCGCDYCDNIKGIDGETALEIIRQYGSIEGMLEKIDKRRFPIPVDWPYEEARRQFKEPKVSTEAPRVPTEAPPVPTQAPPVPTEAPRVPTQALPVPTQAPNVSTQAPPVPTQALPVPTQAPNVSTQAPPVPTQAPRVPTQALPVPTQAPNVSTQAPNVSTEAPRVPTEALVFRRSEFNEECIRKSLTETGFNEVEAMKKIKAVVGKRRMRVRSTFKKDLFYAGLVSFVVYYALCIAVYMNSIDKKHKNCLRGTYYCMTTLYSVGFGDVVPASKTARTLILILMLAGMSVLYVIARSYEMLLGVLKGIILEFMKKRPCLYWLLEADREEMKTVTKIIGYILMVAAPLISIGLWAHSTESYNWLESFYLAAETIATVGYGDVHFGSTAGMLGASVFMILGIPLAAIGVAKSIEYLMKFKSTTKENQEKQESEEGEEGEEDQEKQESEEGEEGEEDQEKQESEEDQELRQIVGLA